MQITGAAVIGVAGISGFLDLLFNKKQKVNIGLIGDGNNTGYFYDSTTLLYNNAGWETGIPLALNSLNLGRYGTGLIGCDNANSNYSYGFGQFVEITEKNSIPRETTINNGWTAHMPTEWHAYMSNWGTSLTAEGATTDDKITSLGTLRPWGLTQSDTLTSSRRYIVNGNEDSFQNTRPFEGLTNALNVQLWYLKTNNSLTGGTLNKVDVQKASNNDRVQNFVINNLDAVSAVASGLTYTISFGTTSSAPVTFVRNNNNTAASNLRAGITAAFPSWDPTVGIAVSGLRDGDFNIRISSNIAFPSDNITLNLGGMTHRYYDATYAPGLSTISYGVPINTGSFGVLVSETNLTAGSQTLNATGPAHLARRDFAVGASASRITNVGTRWAREVTGPWCSMFLGTNIAGTTNGYAVTNIVDISARSARAQLIALRNQSNQYLGSVFQALAEHAGYSSPAQAPLLLRVYGGAFDATDTNGSTGPSGGLSSNTAAGLRDNWQGIVNRVHDVYNAYGWTASNVYWLFASSAPTVASDSNLSFARNAALEMTQRNARTAAINLFTLNGGITNDINGLSVVRLHTTATVPEYLTYTGYRVYSQVEWSSIQQAYGASPPPSNTAPTALFTWSPLSPQDTDDDGYAYVTVDASTSTDPQTLVNATYTWNWNDDNVGPQVSNGITAYISLPVGNTDVTLTVTDTGGSAGNTSGIITVLPYSAPPSPGSPTATITAVPGFTVTDTDGNGSETILFSGAGSTSPNGAITNYAWSKNGVSTGASGVTTSMLFTVTGTNQTVGLMVTDISGNTASSLQYITVNPKTTGPGAVSNSTTVWFGGKVLTTEQYIKILEAFYPNLLR